MRRIALALALLAQSPVLAHHGAGHGSRQLTVPITDRCDCNSLDLSAGAAWRLGVPLDGIAQVRISY